MDRRLRRLALLLATATALTTGCLERKETLRIHDDGSVDVAHEITGDPADLAADRPDALPSGTPWVVEEREDDGEAGGRVRTRLAFAKFPSVDRLPESHGRPDDPAPLRARTTLALKPERDGKVRYVFERRYRPRAYQWRQRIAERVSLEMRRDADAGPAETRARAAEVALAIERETSLVFLDQALAAAGGDAADASVALRCRSELETYLRREWTKEMLLALEGKPADERRRFQARFQRETAREAGRLATRALLTSPTPGERELLEGKLRRAFTDARRTLLATESLENETFEVRVEFPCPVTQTNGTVAGNGETAVFRFSGRDLFDEERVLRAVAVAPGREAGVR